MIANLKNKDLFREKCFLNGLFTDSDTKKVLNVTNPATNKIIGTVPNISVSELNKTIEDAFVAQKKYEKLSAEERSELLLNWYNLVILNKEDLAQILTTEQGKPIQEARGEIEYSASFIKWFAGEALRVYGDIIPSSDKGKRIMVLKSAIGVVGGITPWNFPAAMIAKKCAPALAVGCSIIIKAPSLTPFSSMALMELASKAGFPSGVINCVTGNAKELGKELTQNPKVRKISFTGSTRVGKILMSQSAETIKKVSLELGGNAPFIVFNDANIDKAVEGAMESKFRNTGQTCVCVNRFFIQKSIYEDFKKKFIQKVSELKVGNGFDNVNQGPLINIEAVEKIEKHIKNAVDNGAKIEIGGKRHKLGGTFFEPTILSAANSQMLFNKEETFGPVAALIPFDSESDVLDMANNTEYGLAGYFYTKDLTRAWKVAENLECGIIGVNTGSVSNAVAPFGGIKESGIGREGSHYGIDDYIEIKQVCIGGIE